MDRFCRVLVVGLFAFWFGSSARKRDEVWKIRGIEMLKGRTKKNGILCRSEFT